VISLEIDGTDYIAHMVYIFKKGIRGTRNSGNKFIDMFTEIQTVPVVQFLKNKEINQVGSLCRELYILLFPDRSIKKTSDNQNVDVTL
jgi:hypothetical protein